MSALEAWEVVKKLKVLDNNGEETDLEWEHRPLIKVIDRFIKEHIQEPKTEEVPLGQISIYDL